jgi:hypothetical protein
MLHSHRNAWANLHLLGQTDAVLAQRSSGSMPPSSAFGERDRRVCEEGAVLISSVLAGRSSLGEGWPPGPGPAGPCRLVGIASLQSVGRQVSEHSPRPSNAAFLCFDPAAGSWRQGGAGASGLAGMPMPMPIGTAHIGAQAPCVGAHALAHRRPPPRQVPQGRARWEPRRAGAGLEFRPRGQRVGAGGGLLHAAVRRSRCRPGL